MKSMQYWRSTTFKHMASVIAEGMSNVDIPCFHSMVCISIHNTSDFSDTVPFPIERLNDSIEEVLEDAFLDDGVNSISHP
jgi:hypothetical protein